jgi:hypothetical protein
LLTAVGVGLYLVKVLLLSSPGLGPLHVKSGADLGEGFSDILAFSSLTVRASSLCVSSSSHTIAATGGTVVGLGGGGGGRGLPKANANKSATHQ